MSDSGKTAVKSISQFEEWGRKHLIHPGRSDPIIIKEGEGVTLRDVNGKEYIDFRNEQVVVGYGRRDIVESINEQLKEFPTSVPRYMNLPAIRLAKLLSTIVSSDLSKFYFACGGSEVVEFALKLAKRYTGRQKIISRWGGYHGATMGALSASGTPLYKDAFDPNAPGFIHVPPPYCYRCDFGLTYPECALACVKIIESAIEYESPNSVAGIIVEPIIGGGGAIIPPDGYLPELRKLCDRYAIPLIFDEIYTGFGRTGRMFSYEHWDCKPDLLCMGKGLSSTYVPLAGLATNERIANCIDIDRGEHVYTNQMNPLGCAAALANINVILREKLVENAAKVGDYFLKALKDVAAAHVCLGEVRGKGLLLAVEVVKNIKTKEADLDTAKKVIQRCVEGGLLLALSRRRMRDAAIIVFSPPLVATEEDVDKGLAIFGKVLKAIRN